MQFRIGVNLGDVIQDRGDIYGEGVNIAARLESLAVSGIRQLAGKSRNLSLKDASVETVFYDPQTGERLAVSIDTKPLRSISDESEEMSWETIEKSLWVYGKLFRERGELFR